MKKLLFAWLILAPAAQAQAQDISCPKFYPSEDTVLAETPHQFSGKGVLKKQELSGANWMGGDFNDSFGEMAGGSVKVRGGVDIAVPGFAKWFVCWYGGGRAVAWWAELTPATVNAGKCRIQLRNKTGRDPMDARLVCK
jgi:hypothetical protein